MKKKIILATVLFLGMVQLTNISVYANEVESKPNQNQNESGSNNNGNIPSIHESNIQSKNIMVSSVNVTPSVIEPGKEFSLTYRIENISGRRIEGLSLKIVAVEGKGTLAGFIPVGTTNEIYAGSIGIDDVKDVTVKLASDPSLKAGTYNFLTSVMFNLSGEEQEEITKLSGIMLTNKSNLDIEGVECSTQDDGSLLVGNLNNSGEENLRKVEVNISINGEKYKKYIGKIEGESEQIFEIPVSAIKESTKAVIEVKYEDDNGVKHTTNQEVDVEKSIEINNDEINAGEEEVKSSGFWGSIKRFFGIGA